MTADSTVDDPSTHVLREDYLASVIALGWMSHMRYCIPDAVGIVLGLDQCQPDVVLVTKNAVGPLSPTARHQLAAHSDAAFGEWEFLAYLQHLIPPGLTQGGRDEFGADVAFA
jgi:hypothetical protein